VGVFYTFFAKIFFTFIYLFVVGKIAGFQKVQWRCRQRTSYLLLYLYAYIYYILPAYSF
jgi:hypothetical protein